MCMRLEVMVEWCGVVFEARHLADGEAFHLGRDFPCDIEAMVARMDGGEAQIRVPPDASGELLLGETTQPIEVDRPTRIPPGARARLQIGELSLYFATVEPAKLPPKRPFAMFDQQGASGMAGALVLHALAVVIIVAAPLDPERLDVMGLDFDDRFVSEMIFRPEEIEPPPVEAVADAEPGEQGEQGVVTDAPAPVEPAPAAPAGPRTDRAQAKALAVNTARSIGQELQGLFPDADAPKLDGGGWVRGDDGTGGSGNHFAELGPPAGAGGVGPGTSVDVPIQTHRPPAGLPGAQSRHTRRPKVPKPVVIPGEPRVAPGLEREVVRRVVRGYRSQTRTCYEQRLQVMLGLNGKIRMKWVVGPSGRVIAAVVESSTMGDPQVASCLRRRILHWRFPPPDGGGTVAVRYPFLFKES